MRYCGTVTDNSYFAAGGCIINVQPGSVNGLDSMVQLKESKHSLKRIYSDEVPMASKEKIEELTPLEVKIERVSGNIPFIGQYRKTRYVKWFSIKTKIPWYKRVINPNIRKWEKFTEDKILKELDKSLNIPECTVLRRK